MNISVAELKRFLPDLRVGTSVLLTGTIYTARDAAHRRLADLIVERKELPLNLSGAVLYYCGPCPAKPGEPIGSCGPTTASRMDSLTPLMLKHGVIAVIGKGPRSPETMAALKSHGAVYFAATGGVGALLAQTVQRAELVAFADLGPEAIYRLEVRDFPVIVAVDTVGNNIYERT